MSDQGTFVWNELATSDVDGAKAFYTNVIGWTVDDVDMGENGTYHILKDGDEMRGGLMSTDEIPGDVPQGATVVITVTDQAGNRAQHVVTVTQ